jgi:hypothetical protein
MCVAVGHFPVIHLLAGSGYAMQYLPADKSMILVQPSQFSTTTWQLPPLKPQPFFVMKPHSFPTLMVWQTIVNTPFSNVIFYFKWPNYSVPDSRTEITAVK